MSNTPQAQTAVTRTDERPVEFIPYGNNDKIKLTVEIVKNVIAKRTKLGHTCGNRDAMQFIMLCAGKRLNPFENDAYLVGYDTKEGPAFSLITAEQAFLKRAELHPQYDGMESGLIIQNEDGTLEEVQGEFYLKGQECLGGWARVHLKTRKIHTYERLLMHKYFKPGPFWENNPEHQIAKCARVAALRRSFPTMLGGLYLAEEMPLPMSVSVETEFSPSRLVDVTPRSSDAPAQATTVVETGNAPEKTGPQAELAAFVTSEGFSFDQFRTWGADTGQLEDPTAIESFADVPEKVATRILRAKAGLIKALKQIQPATLV